MAAGGSGWWDNWLQTAKEKGSSVLEFMKKDLDEFTATVQQETSSIVNSTAATLRDKLNIEDNESTANVVKRSFSGFLDTVSTAFTIPRDANDDEEAFVIKNDVPVVLNRLELQLLLLQRDMKTYLVEPSGRPEDYDTWLQGFDLDSKQNELAEMMASNGHLRSVYNRLVPAELSHPLFWHRYFYRVHQLLEAEERRQALKQRADCPQSDEVELAWDEDDELNHHVLTPQETDRILDEYQRECEERALSEPNIEQSKENEAESTATDSIRTNQSSPSAQTNVTLPASSASPDREGDAGNSSAGLIDDRIQRTLWPESLMDELNRLPQCDAGVPSDSNSDMSKVDSPKDGCDNQPPTNIEINSNKDSQHSSKDASSNDDEWEKDFDIALTEEVMKELTILPTTALNNAQEEDWESWQ